MQKLSSDENRYLNDGLIRFISLAYAEKESEAGMIGFTLDVDIPQKLKGKIKEFHCSKFIDKTVLNFPDSYKSIHTCNNAKKILISHLFFYFSKKTDMPILDWIGKKQVINHDKEVPFRLLKRVDSLSVGESENLIIKGDNLEALKALLPYYYNKVKCIYIDPPYNTGNENWIYNDKVNSPEIKKWLGRVVGSEGEDLSRHDKWLCMIYPRLKLLRELLAEDGVIFVSIDDDEVHNLRALMNEIFELKILSVVLCGKRNIQEVMMQDGFQITTIILCSLQRIKTNGDPIYCHGVM